MEVPQWSEAWFKPSKRILVRYLSFNFRRIIGLAVIVFNYFESFILATSEQDIIGFLTTYSGSSNVWIIGLSIGIALLFAYLILLIISNLGTVIYAALLYVTMHNQVTKNYITIKKGIIFKQNQEIPLQRLTDSQIRIGILDRILGTADVVCNTASARDRYIFQTLHQRDAYQLHDFLISQIRRVSEGLDEKEKTSSISKIFSDPRIIAELKEINKLVKDIKIQNAL